MRIGIFTETYAPYISGLVTSEIMLKKALEKLGHEVYVVTANLEDFHYKYDEKERILKIPGIPTGIYDSRLTSIYPVRAVNKIRKWNLDVIHSQTEFGIGTFARLLAKQLNIPLVHTYHTMYEDYVHYITKGYFNKSSKKIVEYLTLFYCDKTVSELIVPTKKTYDLFKEKYNVDREVHIIPTGIEIERFYKENIDKDKLLKLKKKLKITSDDFVGIFIGRLGQEKNIVFLLDVVKNLKKKLPNFKFLLVGDGPDYELYSDIIKEYGIEDRVIMTGKVPWEEVPYYYHLSSIFLTASHTETQGLTVIEAMASGSVPICIKDESFENAIIDKVDGMLFNTKKECSEIITKFYNNKELLEKMSLQGIKDSNKFSSKYFAESVLEVYNEAIDKKLENTSFLERLVDKVKQVQEEEEIYDDEEEDEEE